MISRPCEQRLGFLAAVGLDHADDDIDAFLVRACAAESISKVLPTPGAAPRKIFSRPRAPCCAVSNNASGEGVLHVYAGPCVCAKPSSELVEAP